MGRSMGHVVTGVHRDPDKTREDILSAATSEIVEHGYGGARIDKIAARSGFNKRMIYHYFGDKQQLYAEVLKQVLSEMQTAEQTLECNSLSPSDGVERITRFVWRYLSENTDILSLLATENLHQAKFLSRLARERLPGHTLVRRLQKLVKGGTAAGLFRATTDPVNVLLTILSLSFFYLSNYYTLSAIFGENLQGATAMEKWEDHIVHVVLSSLLP